MLNTYYQNLQQSIHDQNVSVGWWDNSDKWTFITKLMLTVSELSEALEGDRKNLMDDHLPHRKMLEVEIADAVIRLLDIGGSQGEKVEDTIDLQVRDHLSMLAEHSPPVPVILFQSVIFIGNYAKANTDYTYVLAWLHAACEHLGLDLKNAMQEKIAYNAKRADHKRENRAAENGKKY